MDKEAQKIGAALQRKFNLDRAMYLRHPERDEYFNEMADEALYQAEKLGYRKLPKDKPPLKINGNFWMDNKERDAWRKGAKDQREADIKHYEGSK